MGLNTCNILQALAILQLAIFHKLAKAKFVTESQPTDIKLTAQVNTKKSNTVFPQIFKINVLLAASNFT